LKKLRWCSGSGVLLLWVSDVDNCEVNNSGSRKSQAESVCG
jgi:hypothetical protein